MNLTTMDNNKIIDQAKSHQAVDGDLGDWGYKDLGTPVFPTSMAEDTYLRDHRGDAFLELLLCSLKQVLSSSLHHSFE